MADLTNERPPPNGNKQKLARCDARPNASFDMRFKLYLWTNAVQAASDTFRHFLMGTLRTSESTAVRLRRAYIATGTPAAVADVTIAALPAPQLSSVSRSS